MKEGLAYTIIHQGFQSSWIFSISKVLGWIANDDITDKELEIIWYQFREKQLAALDAKLKEKYSTSWQHEFGMRKSYLHNPVFIYGPFGSIEEAKNFAYMDTRENWILTGQRMLDYIAKPFTKEFLKEWINADDN